MTESVFQCTELPSFCSAIPSSQIHGIEQEELRIPFGDYTKTNLLIQNKRYTYQIKVKMLEAVEFNPEQVIGKPYARGMLPYGGGVGPDGCIRFAISREESDRRVKRYLQLKKL